MHIRYILSLALAGAVAAPVGAQDRPRGDDAVRVFSYPRILEAARSPRAVLGIATAVDQGLADTAGVRVADVTENGPAARAGIREGDRIAEVNGVSLRISREDAEDPLLGSIGSRRLTRELAKRSPGDEVELRIASSGGTRNVRVRLADRDSLFPRRELPRVRAGRALEETRGNRASLGLSVGSTGSRRDTLGVFVMGVDDEGPAARAGIIEGNRIAAINGVDLRVARADADDPFVSSAHVQRLSRALRDVSPGAEVELRVWQNGQYRNVRVRAVHADSLSRNRRAMIIGDGFDRGPGMFFGPGTRIRREGGPDALRFQLGPEFHRDLEIMLDGALRGARRALDGAPGEVRRLQRFH